MNQYFKQHQIGVSLTVFALGIAPAFIVGIYFLVTSIEKSANEIYSLEIDQQVSESFLEEISKLRDSQDLIDQKSDKLDVLLKDDAESKVALFGEIKRIAEGSGNTSVVLESVDTNSGNSRGVDKAQIVPYSPENILVKISMNGQYDNFTTFLNRIENFPYMSDVISFSLVEQVKSQSSSQSALRSSVQRSTEGVSQGAQVDVIEMKVTLAVYLESIVTNSSSLSDEALLEDELLNAEMGVDDLDSLIEDDIPL